MWRNFQEQLFYRTSLDDCFYPDPVEFVSVNIIYLFFITSFSVYSFSFNMFSWLLFLIGSFFLIFHQELHPHPRQAFSSRVVTTNQIQQKSIQSSAKPLRFSFFFFLAKIVNDWKLINIFAKSSILDIWQCSEYVFSIWSEIWKTVRVFLINIWEMVLVNNPKLGLI